MIIIAKTQYEWDTVYLTNTPTGTLNTFSGQKGRNKYQRLVVKSANEKTHRGGRYNQYTIFRMPSAGIPFPRQFKSKQ